MVINGTRSWLLLVAAAAAAATGVQAQAEPNPPAWPSTVTVFSPSNTTAEIEQKVQSAYIENGGREDHGQFSADHFAFLFMPGNGPSGTKRVESSPSTAGIHPWRNASKIVTRVSSSVTPDDES